MHSGFNSVAVGRNPHICVLVHLAASGIEEIISVVYLCKALGAHSVTVIVGVSVRRVDKAVPYELALSVKAVPAVSAENVRSHVNGGVYSKLAAVLREVILAVKLAKAVCQLYAVDCEIKLSVFVYYLPDSGLNVGNEHPSVRLKVVHSGFNSVAVGRDPHICVLVHLTASGIEEIVSAVDLCKALGAHIVNEVVCTSLDGGKAVAYNKSVFIAPVFTRFKRAALGSGGRINVAAHVYIELAACGRVDYAIFSLDNAIKHLAVFIAIVAFALIFEKSVAKPRHKTGILIKVIPCNVFYVVSDRMGIAVCNVSVDVQPVGALIKCYESAEPRLARDKILCAVCVCAERTAHELTVIVEGVGKTRNSADSRIHRVVRFVKIVEVGFAVVSHDRLPSGGKHAHAGIVTRTVLFKDARQLIPARAGSAEVIPVLPLLLRRVAGQLVDSGQRHAVLVIRPYAVCPAPAFFVVELHQIVMIRKVGDITGEVRSVVPRDIFAVIVGVKPVLDLIFLLLSQRFQHVEMRIDIIAETAADGAAEKSVCIPRRRVCRYQLKTAQHTERVGSRRVDRLGLLDEVAHHRQPVAHNIRGGQGKIFVCQTQLGDICRKALREVQRYRYRSKRAYALCKLKQEIPRGPSLLISSGEHIKQPGELFGDRNLGHIHRKDVCGFSGCARGGQIVNIIIAAVIRAGNITVPCQHSAASGGVVEIKVCLIAPVKVDGDPCGVIKRFVYGSGLRLNGSLRVAVALGLGFRICCGILAVDGSLKLRQLALKHCADSQRAQVAAYIRSEAESAYRSGFGVLKHQLCLCGVDRTALHLSDGLERDLEESELNIPRIDLYRVAVVGRFKRQLGGFTVYRIDGALGKFKLCRLNHVQCL